MKKSLSRLSRRERQIMELIFQKEQATVADILEAIPDDLNYSSVRAQMTILERKGFLKHKKYGRAFVYYPTLERSSASKAALNQVMDTFFNGSVEDVVAALIGMKSAQLSSEEYDRLSEIIEQKKREEGTDA